MTIFISGGCKNGKSSIAEDCCVKLANGGPLYYIATMKALDEEDDKRILKHIQNRDGKGFTTIEQSTTILDCIKNVNAKESTFILDSVTALMINELYASLTAEDYTNDEIKADMTAPKRVADDLVKLCDLVKNIVFVSDFIYEEGGDYSSYTEDYLKALSTVDKALAKKCDVVCEVALGNVNLFKGELPL